MVDRFQNIYSSHITAGLLQHYLQTCDAAEILQVFRADRHRLLYETAKKSDVRTLNFLRQLGLTPADCRANKNEILNNAIINGNCEVLEWLREMGITIRDCLDDNFHVSLELMFRRSFSVFQWFRRVGLTRAHVMPHIDLIMRKFISAPNAFPSALAQLRELGITIDNGLHLSAFIDILRHNCSLDQVRALFDMGVTMVHLLYLRKNVINLFYVIADNGRHLTNVVLYLKELEPTSPKFNGLGHYLLEAAIFHHDFPDRFPWLKLITLEDCRANNNAILRTVILEPNECRREKQIIWLIQRGVTVEDFGLSPKSALTTAVEWSSLELLRQVCLPDNYDCSTLVHPVCWADSRTLPEALEWMQQNKAAELSVIIASYALRSFYAKRARMLPADDIRAVRWLVRHKILSRSHWLSLKPPCPVHPHVLELAFPLLWRRDYETLRGESGLSIWYQLQSETLTVAVCAAKRGCAEGRRLFLPPELWTWIHNFM